MSETSQQPAVAPPWQVFKAQRDREAAAKLDALAALALANDHIAQLEEEVNALRAKIALLDEVHALKEAAE